MPVPAAQPHVDLIGAEAIMEEGRRAFDVGDYRWAAQILRRLVAQPDNQAAWDLQADAYEQMGSQIGRLAEAGTIQPSGDESALSSLAGLMDTFDPTSTSSSLISPAWTLARSLQVRPSGALMTRSASVAPVGSERGRAPATVSA